VNELPPCPECACINTYELGTVLVCPECAHEWVPSDGEQAGASETRDAVGNILVDGDTVTVVKDMKVKGSSSTLKVGTRVRNIRIVDGPSGHDIEAKVDGFGPLYLKSSILKKA
jgi:protein PhnA